MRRALILNVDYSSRIVTCIIRETNTVIRVKVYGNSIPEKLTFLNFKLPFKTYSQGIPCLRNDEFELSQPERNDSIRNGKIISWIGFSDDPKHFTFDRKIGFTDWYGPVDCSNFVISEPGVYISSIDVNDFNYERNGTCLFKLIDYPKPKQLENNCKFFEKMMKYGRKGLPMEEMQVKAIVLSINRSSKTAICFSKQLESSIIVKLPQNLAVEKGQLILFSEYEYDNDTYIPNSKPDSIKIETDRSVRCENNKLLISVWAAFPSHDSPNLERISTAYAGCFGLVEVSDENRRNMEKGAVYLVEITPYFPCGNETNTKFTVTNVIHKISSQESDDFLFDLYCFQEKSKRYQDSSSGNDTRLQEKTQKNQNVRASSTTPSSSSSSENLSSRASSSTRFIRKSNRAEKMSGIDKPDIENCALILRIDEKEFVGFETTQLKLMRVCTENIDVQLREYNEIRFITDRKENGTIMTKEGTANLSPCKYLIRFSNKLPEIETYLIFSSNAKHQTYNKSVGFSKNFGFVIIEDDESYEEQTLYRVFITLKQYENPSLPVFSTVSPLRKIQNDRIFEETNELMQKFEEEYFKNQRNHFAYSQSQIRNATRQPISQMYKGYVLKIDVSGRNKCYGEVLTPIGTANFSSNPILRDSGLQVKEGSWITVKLEEKNKHRKPYLVVDRLIRLHEDISTPRLNSRSITIEASIELIPKFPSHPNVFEHPYIGLAIAECTIENYQEIVMANFVRLGQPVQGPEGRDIYWRMEKISSTRQQPPMSHVKQKNYEDERIHRDIQNNPRGNRSSEYGCTSNDRSQYDIPLTFNNQRPSSNMNSDFSDSYTSRALVTKKINNMKIVFLYNVQKAAVMFSEQFEENMNVGMIFDCEYISIPIDELTHRAPFEVTRIISDADDCRSERKIDDDECFALFEFDLSRQDPRFFDFSFYSGGQFILYSPDVGYILMGPHVFHTSNRSVNAASIISNFEGKQQAARMVGWCRYSECNVPRAMVDCNYQKDGTKISAYVWKVVEIVSTWDHYQQNQFEKKNENLGKAAEELEQMDDIDRQKLHAHREYAFKSGKDTSSQNSTRNYSRSDDSSGEYKTPPSSTRPQSSQSCYSGYDQSVRNRGSATSELNYNNCSYRRETPVNHHFADELRKDNSSLCEQIDIFLHNEDIFRSMHQFKRDEFAKLLKMLHKCKTSNYNYREGN